MMETILPIGIAFVSFGAFYLGGYVRDHVHVVLPYKDPATLFLFALCFLPAVISLTEYKVIEPDNIWYIAFLIAFISCYSLAYIKGELDMVYVNVHTIISDRFPAGAQEVGYVVYYWDKEGNQCMQEQTFKEILKTVIFGIRSPLRLDVGMVRRARPLIVDKLMYPRIEVEAIDVVEKRVTESIVKRWIFRFRVRSYVYTPAPSCIDTTQQWLVSAYNQENLTKELTRKEAQLLETKTTAMSSFYARSADLLVEMINDRTPGAEVYQDVIERLAPEPGMMQIHTEDQNIELPDKPKRRGFLRRRKEGGE